MFAYSVACYHGSTQDPSVSIVSKSIEGGRSGKSRFLLVASTHK
jgi:hypothetical protein